MDLETEERFKVLEARLIAQEHRGPHMLLNLFNRKQFAAADPRHHACWQPVIYRALTFFLPTNPIGAVGWGTAVALIISYFALTTAIEQKRIERRSALFQQTQQIQLTFVEHPAVHRAFYGMAAVADDDHLRLSVVCEMMTDLLDHAAASDLGDVTDAAWGAYCRDTYQQSKPFRDFVDSHATWYPHLVRWLKK